MWGILPTAPEFPLNVGLISQRLPLGSQKLHLAPHLKSRKMVSCYVASRCGQPSTTTRTARQKEFSLAVKIRLARHGAKKRPYYRVVVADGRMPRDGRYIEEVGRYNPLTTPKTIDINLEKVDEWVAKGAQPTNAVAHLLEVARGEKPVVEKKTKVSKKAAAKAAAAAEAAADEASADEAE